MKKVLIIALAILLISFTSKALQGDSCSIAKTFNAPTTSIINNIQVNTYQWFSFIATSSQKTIELFLHENSPSHIHSIILVTGDCTSYTTIDSSQINQSNDTSLSITTNSLVIGTTYYIITKKENNGCTKCTSNAEFDLFITDPLSRPFLIANNQSCQIQSACTGTPPITSTCSITICKGEPTDFCFYGLLLTNAPNNSGWYLQCNFTGSNLGSLPNFNASNMPSIPVCFQPEWSIAGNYVCDFYYYSPTNDNCLVNGNYSRIYHWIINVNVIEPPIAIINIQNSPPFCQGSNICFNNNSLGPINNLTWYENGTTIFCGNCQNAYCTNNLQVGINNISLIASNQCGTSSVSEIISIDDIKAKFSANNVCLGATTVFSNLSSCVGNNPIWLWDFGDGTTSTATNPTHIYSSAGTYTVTLTVTDGNNLQTNTTINSNVIVNPLPTTPIIVFSNGQPTVCQIGQTETFTISNYSPNNSYTVSLNPSNAGIVSSINPNNFSIVFNSINGAYLTITVSDKNKCENTTSILIPSCCLPLENNIQNFINANVNNLTTIPGYTGIAANGYQQVSNQTFYINGIFTINQNFKISNCEIKLGPNAKIYINPNVELIISESHLSSGCNDMWDGIYANNITSTVEIRKSWIENAITAVNISNGAEHKLASTLFNKNKTSILIQNYGGVYIPPTNARIQGNVFTCRDYTGLSLPIFIAPSFNLATDYNTYPTSTMITPYAGARSVIGAELNKITNTATTYRIESNIFDYLTTGIKTVETHSTIYNNEFRLITSIAGAPAYGIYAIGKTPAPLPVSYKAIIGGTPAWQANKFNLCYIGVFTTNNMNADIVKNDFTTISAYAVHTEYSSKFNILNILKNNITNAQVGVHCYWNSLCQTTINENIIKVTAPLLFSNAVGIWIEELTATVTPAPFFYTAFNNRIENVRYGIRAYNLYKANIDNNRIEINPSGSLPRRGIEVLGNSATTIVDNRVKCVPANGNTQIGGVYASLSTNSYMSCNNIQDMGFAIQCAGPMNPSTVYNNTMKNDTRGIWLSNGGIIDQQGDATHPTYNKLQGTFTDQTYASGTTITLGYLSPFYVRTSPAFYFPTSNNFSPGSSAITINPATGAGASPLCIVSPPPIVALRQQIVQDQVTFSSQELKWLSKHSVYSELLNDSTIYSGDILLHNFKDSVEYAAMGKLKDVKKALGKRNLTFGGSDLSTAISENSSILPALNPETESKVINAILLSNLQNNQTTFDAGQLATLRAIANKCPYEYGIAVYEARMLVQPYDSLLTVYENICEGEQNRMMFSETNTTITFREFTIYPNPNNGSMNLNYEIGSHDKGEVIIYDISGRKINAYVLNANVNILKIDENALENGVYMYSIFINGQIAQSDKIVIIK